MNNDTYCLVEIVPEFFPDAMRQRYMMNFYRNAFIKVPNRGLLTEVYVTDPEGVGELEETLKWGEPSYLTPKTKSGSTIRIDWKKSEEQQYAMYFKCTINLVSTFRKKYPNKFNYGGNRSIIFNENDEIPVKELSDCISIALTYHLNKKSSKIE